MFGEHKEDTRMLSAAPLGWQSAEKDASKNSSKVGCTEMQSSAVPA